MPRPSGYADLGNLVDEFIVALQHMSYQPLQHTEEVMEVGFPEYHDKMTTIKDRFDFPITYDGKSYWITLRRRNK